MEDIKINEKEGKITHSITTTHDEDSLVETYRREYMASRIQEEKLIQLPQVLAKMEMGNKLTFRQLEINKEKEKQIKEIFKDMNLDLKEEIKNLRKKYTEAELLKHAEKIIAKTKTKIEKIPGGGFLFVSEITQSQEDMLVELMVLRDINIELTQKLMLQEKQLTTQLQSEEGMKKLLEEIKERMKTIRVFFASQHKNIDKLLDQKAKARQKEKTAEALSQ